MRRVIYLGTPEMSVPPLVGLHEAGFEIPLVVTGPDKRRGRGSKTTPTPVKAAAAKLGLTISHDVNDILDTGADLGVVVAFGSLIRLPLLEHLDFVNLHYSLLPRWRGAAPIERAILAGDTETGVCLMALEEGLDTGPVYRRVTVPISQIASATELSKELTAVAVPLLTETLADGLGEAEAQKGDPTYANKLTQEDFELDLNGCATQANRVVRIGGALTQFRGKRLKIWEASVVHGHLGNPGVIDGDVVACGSNGLRLHVVQPEGKPRLEAKDWLNGAQPGSDEPLGAK